MQLTLFVNEKKPQKIDNYVIVYNQTESDKESKMKNESKVTTSTLIQD